MVINAPKHILVAPLDWGLGHTTRCVPIIRHLLSLGHIPLVAGNSAQQSFLRDIFGSIDFVDLEGYNITYSKLNQLAQIGLLSQLPSFRKTIKAEHTWLQTFSATHHIDGIISDNRYGLHHPHIPSVILTHQLQVRSGLGSLADRAVQKIHYKMLNKFSATWVVDTPGTPNLGGELSHPTVLPANTKYIGLLSRFDNVPNDSATTNTAPLLILLSGPEPLRTHISGILWQQAVTHPGPVIFIDGSIHAVPPPQIPAHITYYPRLSGSALETAITSAGIIICRSGYSSLMDLIALHKKAIIIPTPGQTEQEYLATHLHSLGIFLKVPQHKFNLKTALDQAVQFPFHPLPLQSFYAEYKKTMNQWLTTL